MIDIWNLLIDWFGTTLFTIGETPVNTAGLFRVVIILIIAGWLSKAVRHTLSKLAKHWQGMSQASIYTLGRILHYTLLVLGLIIGLSTIGIDFSNLALLFGALGVGIGFGLQSMVSNFFSGIIILFEKCLKVGDFVELESGVVGEVREINMRSTRITTNDNIDILVPNSEFVNGRVVNWTLDEAFRRIHVPFGVAYGSNKETVRQAGLEAAERVVFTLREVDSRKPQVWFVKFGDSSLDFELVVWLTPEAVKQPARVLAEYLWEIHTSLEQHNLEVPFPQRDVHFRSIFGLKDELARQWLDHQRDVNKSDI